MMILVMSVSAMAELYQWRDENGVLHIGNRPPPDGVDYSVSEEIETTQEELQQIKAQERLERMKRAARNKQAEIDALEQKKLRDEQCDRTYLALHKIATATISGVIWSHYNGLVNNAQHEVRLIPGPSHVVLKNAMECY